jgi:adenylylsulfate kinase
MPISSNLTTIAHQVTSEDRRRRFGHDGAVVWLTGLSASGKSTLAMGLEATLLQRGYSCYSLDGDNVRQGLNSNLGFSPLDRAENIRRIGEVAALFADAGLICITAFISPYRRDRDIARMAASKTKFFEIYVAADLATCESRDPKGLYKRARCGELREFTGISAPYEIPVAPNLILNSANENIENCISTLADFVMNALPLVAD